jgi:hypothetical protein
LLGDLRRREGEVDGSKSFVSVLLLCREYDVDAVTVAVREALRHPEVSLGLVRFCLWNASEEREERPAVIDYPGPEVRQGSASDYAELMGSGDVQRG